MTVQLLQCVVEKAGEVSQVEQLPFIWMISANLGFITGGRLGGGVDFAVVNVVFIYNAKTKK